ncbi:MAG: dihydropteroate synthase [Pseudomonadota bacterium]
MQLLNPLSVNFPALQLARFRLSRKRPFVMGICNVTPDSFSDGGKAKDLSKALHHIENLIFEGADIIDVGGESTRPGATPVSEQEEMDRVIPLLEIALQKFDVPFSLDTQKPAIMQAALELKIDCLNDVNGFQALDALPVIKAADYAVYLCVMHKRGLIQANYKDDLVEDLIPDINRFFLERAEVFTQAGISLDRVCWDPGFGFGKTREQNWRLLQDLHILKKSFPQLLIGVSRKSMFESVTNSPPAKRQGVSVAAAISAATQGVTIVRVHDVLHTVQALDVFSRLYDWSNIS